MSADGSDKDDVSAETLRLRESLKAFATAANHDLNAPLRHIHMFAELIGRDEAGQLSKDSEQYLDRILHSVDRAERLVEALVDYARQVSAQLDCDRVDLTSVVKEAVAPFKSAVAGFGGEVTVGELPAAKGDRNALLRVFSELMDNAVKYRGTGGTHISIQSRVATKEAVAISFTDTGPGFGEGQAEPAFELLRRFTTADHVEGEGGGLAICRQLMDMQGGSICPDLGYTAGAGFILTLPAAD